jgi:hypothetical protein
MDDSWNGTLVYNDLRASGAESEDDRRQILSEPGPSEAVAENGSTVRFLVPLPKR